MKGTFKAVAVAALAAFAALGATPRPAAAETITVMTWGGHWLDIFRPVAAKFKAATGIDVAFVVQSGASDGLTKLMAQQHNPQVDVWTSIESTVDLATKAKLLTSLAPAEIPNLDKIPADMKSDTSVAIWLSPRGIFYRSDLVPFAITKWQDLWDPRLKDKVGVTMTLDHGNFLLLAALLNGGSETDIDPGFAKLKELKPNIHAVYTTDPESIKLLETGEIAVAAWGILPNVYSHLGPGSKYKFVMPPPRFLATIPVSIVKGRSAAQEAAAAKFVNYMLSPDAQTIMASIAGTIPANPAAKVPEKLLTIVPPLPIKDVYHVNWNVMNQHYSEWDDRWMQEIQTR